MDGPLRGFAGGGLGPHPAQVVPGGELLDRLGDLRRQPVELAGDPGVEAGQVHVPVRQQVVVLQERPEVGNGVAGAAAIETVMGQRDRSGAETA